MVLYLTVAVAAFLPLNTASTSAVILLAVSSSQLNPFQSLRSGLREETVRYLVLILAAHSIIFMGLLGTFPTYATEYLAFDKFDRALYQVSRVNLAIEMTMCAGLAPNIYSMRVAACAQCNPLNHVTPNI
jgi:hypothetical protein